MRFSILALLIGCSTLLGAQRDTTTLFYKSPVFAQVGLGAFLLDPYNAEISAAVGYRFTPYFGLGLEWRGTVAGGPSFSDDASLLGLHLRSQSRYGLMISFGAGVVLSATRGSDGFESYSYRSGGGYAATDFGYQLPLGLTFGFYATLVSGQEFDNFAWDELTGLYVPDGGVSMGSFLSFGPKLSFAFPTRGKRR
ncbi:MAG: hypothetical protein AAFZ52_05895 [Bacteroidota bacterium]